MRTFSSDTSSGAHPEVLAAIAEANHDHALSYGADPWTARALDLLRAEFGPRAQPWLVLTGTAANTLALGALCHSWEAVITPATSHLHVAEAAAPERLAGVKLLPVATADGRLRPGDLPGLLTRRGDEHAPQPRVVSIANATEQGTRYGAVETAALAHAAHEHGLLLHVDGARLANAAAAEGVPLAALTTEAGADVVTFGLTKNGALAAEAVVFLTEPPPAGVAWLRKQQGQLAAKMRFVAAQFIALLQDGLSGRAAAHANAMAALLAQRAGAVPGVRITRPVQANAVFAVLHRDAAEALRARFPFSTWDAAAGEVRWMCAWDTRPEDVVAFVAALREAVAQVSDASHANP